MRWPRTKMPPADAPPVKWARWYRDVMGWIVLPTRCDADVVSYAAYLLRRARVDYVDRNGREPDTTTWEDLEEATREEAERTRKAPMTHYLNRDFVSNTEIEAWWGKESGERGPQRGIWIHMGRLDARSPASAKGLAVVAVDVDPKNGAALGDWLPYRGPIDETPSGGVHILCQAVSWPRARNTKEEIAAGIDTRAPGGGIVVPSGLSSPGRTWRQWEAPVAIHDRILDESTWDGPGLLGMGRAGSERGDGHSGIVGSSATASTFAEILTLPAPDGTRQATAAAIVGILARPSSIPEDSLEPALAMLREAGETDMAAWEKTLTRGPRTVEDAVAFVLAWNATRGDPAWRDGYAEKTARSLWKTADRREGGNAGGEDFGIGDAWDPSGAPEGARVEPVAEAAPADDAPAEASEPRTLKLDNSPKVPEGFCLPLSEAYTADDFEADMSVTPISIATLPPWLGWDERPDHCAPYGYGVGPWLDESLAGGLTRGSFWALGALTAKGGKTMFLGQIVEGLTLLSAIRLRDEEDGPIILPFWLTEMERHRDISHRMTGRHLDIDMSLWSRGSRGYLAPGIQSVALRHGQDARVIAEASRLRVRRVLEDTMHPLALARRLTVNLDPMVLPQKRGRHAEDPRRGVKLLQTVKFAVERRCEEVAAEHHIDQGRIIPMLMLDPVHRFVDALGEDRLTAVNAVIDEARTIAHGNKWIVMATSDTTKGSAAGDKGMDGDPAALAAAAFAGTQNLAHEPDTVIVLHAERVDPPDEGPRIVEVPVQVRACLCRRASAGPPRPFIWQPHVGRYIAQDPNVKPTGAPRQSVGGRSIKRTRGRPVK